MTHLQDLGNSYGYSVAFTPKFHAELAGEGIEYSWGCAKGIYRRKPFAQKKKRQSFLKPVSECTSPDELTLYRVRRFSAKARSYILTYHYFASQGIDESNPQQPLKFEDIQTMAKSLKSHRNAKDFANGYIESVTKSYEGQTD